MSNQAISEAEIDIREMAESGRDVPDAQVFKVHIDDRVVHVDTAHPAGEALLSKVDKRPCAFELIAEFIHCDNDVIEPEEIVDLRQRGLKGFITAHKEIVTIFINGDEHPYKIERGVHTVAQILAKVDQTPDGYVLLEEKGGPPMPIPPNQPIEICGCEIFFSQPQSGGSSF
jgi:hypothetical protein